jgi:hypothetical protein
MYVSNAVNAPLLREKGEVKLNVTQNDLQAAVAVSDHVAIMANGFYRNYKNDNYKHNGFQGELGMGYFKPLESNNNLIFEAYGGIGLGKVFKQQEFRNPENGNLYLGSFEANGGKLFVQPSFGFATRFFDIALTPKFSLVKYTSFSSDAYPENELRNDYLYDNEITRSAYLFAEPAITIRGGYKFIKLQAQYGLTLNMGNRIKHDPDFASLGLVFDIAQWYNQ